MSEYLDVGPNQLSFAIGHRADNPKLLRSFKYLNNLPPPPAGRPDMLSKHISRIVRLRNNFVLYYTVLPFPLTPPEVLSKQGDKDADIATIDIDLPVPPPPPQTSQSPLSPQSPLSLQPWDETALAAYAAFLAHKKKQKNNISSVSPKADQGVHNKAHDGLSRRYPAILLVDSRLRSMRATYLRHVRQNRIQATGQNTLKGGIESGSSSVSSSANDSAAAGLAPLSPLGAHGVFPPLDSKQRVVRIIPPYSFFIPLAFNWLPNI